jgi:hypothetical protein
MALWSLQGTCSHILASGIPTVFHQGANSTNRIGIVAQGPNIMIYCNDDLVFSAQDSHYHSGSLIFAARAFTGNGAGDVAFSGLTIWQK